MYLMRIYLIRSFPFSDRLEISGQFRLEEEILYTSMRQTSATFQHDELASTHTKVTHHITAASQVLNGYLFVLH